MQIRSLRKEGGASRAVIFRRSLCTVYFPVVHSHLVSFFEHSSSFFDHRRASGLYGSLGNVYGVGATGGLFFYTGGTEKAHF